jgi:hypothetical protein
MKFIIAILLLLGTVQAQTRAELIKERNLLREYLAGAEADIDDYASMIVKDTEAMNRMGTEIENLKALNRVLESQNKLLMNDLIAMSSQFVPRTVVVPVFEPMPIPLAPEPQTVRVIHDDPPYQAPVWQDTVHCSGYEIPVRGGITLTQQNCH